jgi:perosamine synthetase
VISISDKFLHQCADDEKQVLAALASGQLSGAAEIVATYENALRAAFMVDHAVAVSSGSAAIQTALHIAGAGTEVLVPAIAPLPSLLPVSAAGLRPIAVDTRPNCLDFDPADLLGKISSRTRAALIVPLWGYPIDMTETLGILEAAGIPLIEDAAHAHGALWAGRPVGTFGLAGCFSTHDRKILATGEGGFILTSSAATANAVRAYARLGHLGGHQRGMNFKLPALAAALGVSRLPCLPALIHSRTVNAAEIRGRLSACAWLEELHFPADGKPNYYNLVLLQKARSGEAARAALRRINEAGIPVDQRKYGYDLFYRRPLYSHLATHCPNAEDLITRLIQLPVHPRIGKTDVDSMVEIIRRIGDEL